RQRRNVGAVFGRSKLITPRSARPARPPREISRRPCRAGVFLKFFADHDNGALCACLLFLPVFTRIEPTAPPLRQFFVWIFTATFEVKLTALRVTARFQN